MTKDAESTQSVLDMMQAGVVARKAQASAKLTPVGTERPASGLPAAATTSDADMFGPPPQHELWAFADSIKALLRDGERLLAVLPASNAGGMSVYTTEVPAKTPEQVADAAAAQREFDERMKEQAEEAQASVFEPIVATGWRCPTHDKAETKTSKRGRVYGACPDCDEFER